MNIYRVDYEIDSDSDESTGPPPYSPLAIYPPYQAELSSSLGSSSAISLPPGLMLRNGKRLCDETDGEVETKEAKKHKKIRDCPLTKRIEWMRKNLCRPLPITLREKSARAVAESWSDRFEVKDQLEAMGRSKSTSAFKAEIGVHLKGHNLVSFIRREGGLDALARKSWPEVFQRLLVAVYAETARFDQTCSARKDLSRCIKAFREKTLVRNTLQVGVHRLGLTDSYCQPQLKHKSLDKTLWSLHRKEAFRESYLILYPPLKYPLPLVLRNTDPAKVAEFRRCFLHCGRVARNETEWKQKVGSEAKQKEESGLEQSKESEELFQSSQSMLPHLFWRNAENLSLSERHVELLCHVVKLDFVRAHKTVLTAAFLLLTHPYYSLERIRLEEPQLAPRLQEYRVDVCRILARTLGWLHASLDLPFAVLHYAKLGVNAAQPPCISELARIALAELDVHVRYGHYCRAGEIFWSWFGRLPTSSWLHEEMVEIYCAGVFSSVQERLMEAIVADSVHSKCQLTRCWDRYVKPILRSAGNKIFRVRCLLHRCLSDVTLTDTFRRHLEKAQLVTSFFNLCVLKLSSKNKRVFVDELKVWYKRVQWSRRRETHLTPFLYVVPLDTSHSGSWANLERDTQDYERRASENSARQGDFARDHADVLFSLVVSILLHKPRPFTDSDLISECLETYEKTTVGRHHRIPLLKKLLSLKEFQGTLPPLDPHLYTNEEERLCAVKRSEASGGKYPDPFHPSVKKEDLSFEELTSDATRQFALTTMRDCLEDFEHQDFSSPDQFCRYLRRRDVAAPAWIEFGLKCFRFDHTPR